MQLTLLTRAYCSLCDELRDGLAALLAGRAVAVTEIDVDAHAALEARFGDLVPVLIAGDPCTGRVLCHYRLDVAAVAAAVDDPGDAHRGVA